MTQTLTAYHGTAAEFTGNPTPQTDIYGITGIYMTEDWDDAWYFAGANTEGDHDGERRVYAASIDLTDAEDLTDLEDIDEIIEAAFTSDAAVLILPDMSGVSDREIVIQDTRAVTWG